MILVYTMVLVLLGMVKGVIAWRAGRLGRRYSRAAAALDKHLREPSYFFREGNSNRPSDLTRMAKRTFELAVLAHEKDRLESKHFAWQAWADRFSCALNAVRNWKGKKLPYTLGVLDVWLALYLLDYFGVGELVSARNAIALVQSWLN